MRNDGPRRLSIGEEGERDASQVLEEPAVREAAVPVPTMQRAGASLLWNLPCDENTVRKYSMFDPPPPPPPPPPPGSE